MPSFHATLRRTRAIASIVRKRLSRKPQETPVLDNANNIVNQSSNPRDTSPIVTDESPVELLLTPEELNQMDYHEVLFKAGKFAVKLSALGAVKTWSSNYGGTLVETWEWDGYHRFFTVIDDLQLPVEEECSICQEEYEPSDGAGSSRNPWHQHWPLQTTCGHIFGAICLWLWLFKDKNFTCPICRWDVFEIKLGNVA